MMEDKIIKNKSFSYIYVCSKNIGLDLHKYFLKGVLINTDILKGYTKLLESQPLSDIDDEPAYEYIP